jgi:hypothetical protein
MQWRNSNEGYGAVMQAMHWLTVLLVILAWLLGQFEDAFPKGAARECQSALEWDPLSASKRDPFDRRVLLVALAASELAGVAETARARVV